MAANAQLIAGALEKQADEMESNAAAIQQLFYMQGQNAASAANLTPDTTMAFRGREETADSAAVRLQSELESQQKVQTLKNTLNFDDLSISLADETRNLIAEGRQTAADIAEKKSVSLFDDPLQALANAFTLPWDEQKLEGINDRFKQVKASQAEINQQVQTYSETTNKTAEALTAASVQSLTAGIAANQQVKLLEATNKALALDAQGIQATAQMSASALQMRGQAYNILATEEQRAWMREQREAELERRETERQDKEKRKNLIAEDIAFVKDSMVKDTGKVTMTDDQILNLLTRNHPTIVEMRDRGVIASMQGKAAYGESPDQVVAYIRNTGAAPQTEGQMRLLELNEQALLLTKDEKDKVVRADKAKDVVRAQVEKWENDVGAGNKNNPLTLPVYGHFKNQQAIVNNPAYQYIKDLTEGEATSAVPLDGQVVYDRLVSALSQKKISPKDAELMLSSIGEISRADNASVNKVYEYTGLTQTKAVVMVKPGSALGDLAITAGPMMAAVGGWVPGPQSIPAVIAGATMTGAGVMMNRAREPMDLLNQSSIRRALALGVSRGLIGMGQE